MKKMIMLILALASLACLETAQTEPTPARATVVTLSATPTEIDSAEVGPASQETTSPPEPSPQVAMCGTITASEAVNLRADPTEHSRVLYWLPAKDKVTVIDRKGAWWKVTALEYTGYVKADYIKECE